ncbi:hypothetical protein AYI68_g7339 [Smittium mucronatum]|uniref:Pentatricopeptide repeat-containing protein n=1 Tax=Smittium mucronatum TaxID=133383 RepID=A0A1R0GNL6_9FUNG|nr:hypothetical protein AYI68_g7479 [Smittium mucronatum]OLY78603.1 hypothetical protein AYI68_g7339 [Smittium mucronatum]
MFTFEKTRKFFKVICQNSSKDLKISLKTKGKVPTHFIRTPALLPNSFFYPAISIDKYHGPRRPRKYIISHILPDLVLFNSRKLRHYSNFSRSKIKSCHYSNDLQEVRTFLFSVSKKSPSFPKIQVHNYSSNSSPKDLESLELQNPWEYIESIILKKLNSLKNQQDAPVDLSNLKFLSFSDFETLISLLSGISPINYKKRLRDLNRFIIDLKFTPSPFIPKNPNSSKNLDPKTNPQTSLNNMINTYRIWTACSSLELLDEIDPYKESQYSTFINQQHCKKSLQKLYYKGYHSHNVALCLNAIIYNTEGFLISKKHKILFYNRFLSDNSIGFYHLILLAKDLFNQIENFKLDTLVYKYPNISFDQNSHFFKNALVEYSHSFNHHITISSSIKELLLHKHKINNILLENLDSLPSKSSSKKSQKPYNQESDHNNLFFSDVESKAILRGLILLCRYGHLNDSIDLFFQCQNLFNRSSALNYYNHLIFRFSMNNDFFSVSQILYKMRLYNLHPDIVTWNSILKGMLENRRSRQAYLLLNKINTINNIPISFTIPQLSGPIIPLTTQDSRNNIATKSFDFLRQLSSWKFSLGRTKITLGLHREISWHIESLKLLSNSVVPNKVTHSIIIGGLKKLHLYQLLFEYRKSIVYENQLTNYQKSSLDLILARLPLISQKISELQPLTSDVNFGATNRNLILINSLIGYYQSGNLLAAGNLLLKTPHLVDEYTLIPLLKVLVKYTNQYYDDSVFHLVYDVVSDLTLSIPNWDTLISKNLNFTPTLEPDSHLSLESNNSLYHNTAINLIRSITRIPLHTKLLFSQLVSKNPFYLSQMILIQFKVLGFHHTLVFIKSLFSSPHIPYISFNTTCLNILIFNVAKLNPELSIEFFYATDFENSLNTQIDDHDIKQDSVGYAFSSHAKEFGKNVQNIVPSLDFSNYLDSTFNIDQHDCSEKDEIDIELLQSVADLIRENKPQDAIPNKITLNILLNHLRTDLESHTTTQLVNYFNNRYGVN